MANKVKNIIHDSAIAGVFNVDTFSSLLLVTQPLISPPATQAPGLVSSLSKIKSIIHDYAIAGVFNLCSSIQSCLVTPRPRQQPFSTPPVTRVPGFESSPQGSYFGDHVGVGVRRRAAGRVDAYFPLHGRLVTQVEAHRR